MKIRICKECGEELDSAENDVTGLCDACWEDMTQEEYGDEIGDALDRRDDEMGCS